MAKQISLNVKCMKCGHSLMDGKKPVSNLPSINCDIIQGGKSGKIWLCSIYGCHDHEIDIDLDPKSEVEFYCPHCREKLNTNIRCSVCDASIVKFHIEIGGVVGICSRNGCRNHYVMFDDLESAIRKFHKEYGM